MNYAVTERTEQRHRKNIVIFALMSVGLLACVIIMITCIKGGEIAEDMKFFIFGITGTFIFMFSTIPLSYFLALNNYIKMIGKELKKDITDEHIKLEDDIDGINIEKEFKWTDINKVIAQIYHAGFMKKTYCLKFITNNQNEYEKLSKKEKKEMTKSEKRSLMLDSEFYVDCEKDDINRYLKYWGKRFESQSLFFSQIKVRK